jgi:hypothetical protein
MLPTDHSTLSALILKVRPLKCKPLGRVHIQKEVLAHNYRIFFTMAEESKSKEWWQTLPAILAAVAATITAISGLVVALYQTGNFGANQPVKPSVNPSQTPSSAATSEEVVRNFYKALSAANGYQAIKYVNPSLINKPHFQPDKISATFGSYRRPLEVSDLHATDESHVFVAYNYLDPNGSTCQDTANVTIVSIEGRFYIDGIHVQPGGC